MTSEVQRGLPRLDLQAMAVPQLGNCAQFTRVVAPSSFEVFP
jgi:hypothetical protein